RDPRGRQGILLRGRGALGRDRRRGARATSADRDRADASRRQAAPHLGAADTRGAPLLRAGSPRRGRRRYSAIEAHGRRDGGVVVAGGGLLALLRQSAL